MTDSKIAHSGSDDFELLDGQIVTELYGDNLDQGHGMALGARIKIGLIEMQQLKAIIDKEINLQFDAEAKSKSFNVNINNISGMRVNAANAKLTDIPVMVEAIDGRILVKVGPCDLSGVGGHLVREQMIKDLVNQALVNKGYDLDQTNFTTVNVSACVGVRGRLQMALGFFVSNRERDGEHMNAYVKTAGDPHLTHWEPRQGPQRFFNDTVCAMVTSTTTSIFEQGIRGNSIHSSAQATADILKNPRLVTIFDAILSSTKERIVQLVSGIKSMLSSTTTADYPTKAL